MEDRDDWTCWGEPFTEINLQDEFVTPIVLVLNYIVRLGSLFANRKLNNNDGRCQRPLQNF